MICRASASPNRRVEGHRHIHREGGRGVGHRLLKRSRQHMFEVFLIPRPSPLQEFIDDDARARLPVTVHAVRQRLPVQRRALADHQRRLEQAQCVNKLRCVKSELESDGTTERVANHVCAAYAQVRQQASTVACLLREAHGLSGGAAVDVTAAVIADQSVPIREAALRQQRSERVGDERPMDADDRLPYARVLVLQRDAVDFRSIHARSVPQLRCVMVEYIAARNPSSRTARADPAPGARPTAVK